VVAPRVVDAIRGKASVTLDSVVEGLELAPQRVIRVVAGVLRDEPGEPVVIEPARKEMNLHPRLGP